MPTYAYACRQCGHRFEAVQSFADASLTECPECQGPLRKEYGSIGVTFNGSGFYRTDSRAASGNKGTGSTDSGNGAAAKSSDGGGSSSSSSSTSGSSSSSSSTSAGSSATT